MWDVLSTTWRCKWLKPSRGTSSREQRATGKVVFFEQMSGMSAQMGRLELQVEGLRQDFTSWQSSVDQHYDTLSSEVHQLYQFHQQYYSSFPGPPFDPSQQRGGVSLFSFLSTILIFCSMFLMYFGYGFLDIRTSVLVLLYLDYYY